LCIFTHVHPLSDFHILPESGALRFRTQAYHYGLRSNHLQDSSTYQNPTLAAGYHTYAVDWTPTYIKWYIDGVLQKTHTNSGPNDITATPMHLDIDMYLGGSWAGAVGGSTVLPQYMYVDYVRVYNKMPASCSLPPSC
jgi:beta-glucanase (GH16 family)